jgi:hypothetical protein
MVDEPRQADTKLSWAGDSMELVGTIQQRQYLNKVCGQGLGPHWRGAVVAPHHRGRILQGVNLINSMPLLSVVPPVYSVQGGLHGNQSLIKSLIICMPNKSLLLVVNLLY